MFAPLALSGVPHRFLLIFSTSVIFVFISCLGFLIDPAAAPARVTLGVVRKAYEKLLVNLEELADLLMSWQVMLLVVLQNYISLASNTPRDTTYTWLGKFLLISFLFNIVILFEQLLVHFGLLAQQWLNAQRSYVNSVQKWDRMLYQQRHGLDDLFREWDTNGDGRITKKQFLRGIKKLAPATPIAEARSRRAAP